ncbi:MAG: hypothetical protein EXQ59_00925 [Acidobacteria bacterium]|nr:hypothetical protein [Acidobacteriota bacterium]
MRLAALLLFVTVLTSACAGGVLKKEYEYEEELYLSLDGSATLNVHASVPALVALHGVDLDVSPRARIDRDRVRALFAGPGVEVSRVSLARRDGRRMVHVSLQVQDVRQLSRVALFTWSTYQFERRGDVFEYHQIVGSSAGKPITSVGWTGNEIVAFRMHIPSEIPFHNAPSRTVQRGNILAWEQLLSERLKGTDVDIEVQMATASILYSTLLLFGGTVIAALLTFSLAIWWVARHGRNTDAA